MKNCAKSLAILMIPAILGACTTDPVERYQKQQEALRDAKQEDAEKLLKQTPDWYMNPALADEKGIYAAASGYADDLQASIDQATMLAKYALAGEYQEALSGQTRYLRKLGNNGHVDTQSDTTIDAFVNEVTLRQYRVVDKKIYASQGGFRTFVLLHIPYDKMPDQIALHQDLSEMHRQLLERVRAQAGLTDGENGAPKTSGALNNDAL